VEESDERLFERLRTGDLSACDALYERYERRLFGFILGYVADRAEAEDLFHEAFVALYRDAPDALAAGSVRAWLFQTARNASLNRLRSRERRQRALSVDDGAAPSRNAEEQLNAAEAGVALQRAVSRLPESLSELYRLRTSGLSYEQMAEVLEIPVGTVKSRMHEMVSQLKKEMQPWTVR
jgi:RNA polymerase sigma-70 factor (ECF subfamily)